MHTTSADAAANSRATLIRAITIIFLVLAWGAVLARSYVRAVLIRNYGWDDAIMLLAVLTYTIYAAFNLLLVSWGFGNSHLSMQNPRFISDAASYILVTFSLYAATMVILKISLGIFYLRIVVSRWHKVTVCATVGIAAIFTSYYFFAILFSCGLPSHFLANALNGKCSGTVQSRYAVNITAGVINAVSDFILAILPIALINRACIPLPAKISASLVLLLGCLGSAASVVRLSHVHGLSYNIRFFEVGVDITIWSIIEVGLCITAASLATLRPLFHCCIEGTRRSAITPGQSFVDLNSKSRHRRPSSLLSFQDRSPASHTGEDWPLRKLQPTFNPTVRELDNLPTPSPGLSRAGMTRKANLHHGKVQWLQPAPPPKFPPKRPTRPEAPWSEEHPAFRQKPDMSASNFIYNPTQLARSLSKSSFKRGAGRLRTANNDPRAAGQTRMEEVGVGAWRVCDDKADRKG